MKPNVPGIFVSTKLDDKRSITQRTTLVEKRLEGLLSYATTHSPYYKKLYEGLPAKAPLEALPTTNKAELMENFGEWLTDRTLTPAEIEHFIADKANIGAKLRGKYLPYTTSGSTGHPVIILYDNATFMVSTAVSMFRSIRNREVLRAFSKTGRRTAGLFATDGFYLAGGSIKYAQRLMPRNKTKIVLSVLKPLDVIVQQLNAFQPAMLGSYPSTLELLVEEQREGRLKISPLLIMPGGEYLSPRLRKELAETFFCEVLSAYSSTEGGNMACECEHHRYHINEDWCILEAVDENCRPVANGTPGDKVLLTNLANYTQPIIRYELTDRVIIHDANCPCGRTTKWIEVEGRTDDTLVFSSGKRVPPIPLYAVLKEIPGILSFQLEQRTEDELVLRLNATGDSGAVFEQAKTALENYFAQLGLWPAIVYSSEKIQVHPQSGKVKMIVNRVEKNS